MNKTFGINAMSSCLFNHFRCRNKLSRAECQEIPKFLCDCMIKALIANKKIRLERLGVISTKVINSRNSRNPKTGEKFLSTTKKGIRFKASHYACQRINNPNSKIPKRKIVRPPNKQEIHA